MRRCHPKQVGNSLCAACLRDSPLVVISERGKPYATKRAANMLS
jgi:hypothetical protein